jgi:hypothetical protein
MREPEHSVRIMKLQAAAVHHDISIENKIEFVIE